MMSMPSVASAGSSPRRDLARRARPCRHSEWVAATNSTRSVTASRRWPRPRPRRRDRMRQTATTMCSLVSSPAYAPEKTSRQLASAPGSSPSKAARWGVGGPTNQSRRDRPAAGPVRGRGRPEPSAARRRPGRSARAAVSAALWSLASLITSGADAGGGGCSAPGQAARAAHAPPTAADDDEGRGGAEQGVAAAGGAGPARA